MERKSMKKYNYEPEILKKNNIEKENLKSDYRVTLKKNN